MIADNKDAVGQKYDTNKLPIFQGFIKYFPRAIAAIAAVSQAGANKYAAGKFPTKWREVPEGELRYADAMGRHMLEEAKNNPVDTETNCLHLAQEAWNNLARLELLLVSKEIEAETDPAPAKERRTGEERRRYNSPIVFQLRGVLKRRSCDRHHPNS